MSENRHRTIVEITADSQQAEQTLQRLQALFDQLAQKANIPIGGGLGGLGGLGGAGGIGTPLTPGGVPMPAPATVGGWQRTPTGLYVPPGAAGGGAGSGGGGGGGAGSYAPPPGDPMALQAGGEAVGRNLGAGGMRSAVSGGLLVASQAASGYRRWAAMEGEMSLTAPTRRHVAGVETAAGVGGALAGAATGFLVGGPWGALGGAAIGAFTGSQVGTGLAGLYATKFEKHYPGWERIQGMSSQMGNQQMASGRFAELFDAERLSGRGRRGLGFSPFMDRELLDDTFRPSDTIGQNMNQRISRAGVKYGIDAFEGARILDQYAQGAGGLHRASDLDLIYNLHSQGISSGALGAYRGLERAGVGWNRRTRGGQIATDGIAGGKGEFMAATAMEHGLAGAGVEQLLGQIASGVKSLASGGMRPMAADVENTIANFVNRSPGLGMEGATQATMGIMNQQQSLKNRLLSPYKSMSEGFMLADAFGGGRSYIEAMEYLESAGAGAGFDAINRSGLGQGDRAAMLASTTGRSIHDMRGLSGLGRQRDNYISRRNVRLGQPHQVDRGYRDIAAAEADKQSTLFDTLISDKQAMIAMVQTLSRIENNVIVMARAARHLIQE